MQLYIWNNKLIFVLYSCWYLVRTTNTCINMITLQYELDIYILGSNTALRGVGEILRNSAIFDVPSYFLQTDDDGTSRSLCTLITTIDSHDTELENIINKELVKNTLWLKLNKLSLIVAKSNILVFHQPKKKILFPTIEIEDTKINCA